MSVSPKVWILIAVLVLGLFLVYGGWLSQREAEGKALGSDDFLPSPMTSRLLDEASSSLPLRAMVAVCYGNDNSPHSRP